MTDSKQFDKYKEYKEKLLYHKSGIRYELILANDVWRILFMPESLSIFKSFATFFITPDFSDLKETFKKVDVLFSSVSIVNRPDALEIISLARKNLSSTSAYIDFNTIKKNLFFKWKHIIQATRFVFGRLGGLSFSQKLNISSKLATYCNSISRLEETFSGFDFAGKSYVAFHSTMTWDALLCQFFNTRGIPTYSLSHGLSYVTYKRYVPFDAIAAENIAASKVLVWGESSVRDLSGHYGFPAERIGVSGNLKYPAKDLTPLAVFKSGLVLLGRRIYEESNSEIIKIVSEFSRLTGCKMTVRLHPSLSLEKYKAICEQNGLGLIVNGETVNATFQSGLYDFAIVNNSATYFEAMYYNCICFRYEPSENEIYAGLDDRFHDTATLTEKVERFKQMNTTALKDSITNILVDNLGMGINRFSELID